MIPKNDNRWSLQRGMLTSDAVMITFIEGTLEEVLPSMIVVNAGGVGYQILIPLSSYNKLPVTGTRLRILTHHHIREDLQLLYGFTSATERDLFRLLLAHVTGVGPKLALAILSGMSVEAFKGAVVTSDIVAISKISGVGKKTAERVVLELKDKLGVAAEWEAASRQNLPTGIERHLHDAVLALISLGYRQVDAHKAVKAILSSLPADASVEDVVRESLQRLLT
jgi:Holliday junction DNA helicase RuvA